MSQNRICLGRYSEDRAVRFLKTHGYKILERNYRSLFGEIDIIAEDGNVLVFVEVKSCTSSLFGNPSLKINKKKRSKIIRCALSYLKRREIMDTECRIDIVSITIDEKDGGNIELIKDAFGIE